MTALAAEYVRWLVLWVGLFVLFYGGSILLEVVV